MKKRDDISSFDTILDAKYGKVGTTKREGFRKEAAAYCIGENCHWPTESGGRISGKERKKR